jgi:cyclic beta-1,2-glucan synthetase
VALNHPAAHADHPAFSKLFLQTERAGEAVLLARRRPRSPGERHPCMFHALLEPAPGGTPRAPAQAGGIEVETDRRRFIGRGRSLHEPLALEPGTRLSGTAGDVLDPVLAIRRSCVLPPGGTRRLAALLGVAGGRAEALAAIDRFSGADVLDSVREDARALEEARLGESGLSRQEAEHAQALAGAILFGDPRLRARPEVLLRSAGPVEELRSLGIPPDPFVVLHGDRPAAGPHAPRLERMARYWRALGLGIGLVIRTSGPEGASGPSPESARIGVDGLPPAILDRIDAVARLVITRSLPDPGSLEGAGDPGGSRRP